MGQKSEPEEKPITPTPTPEPEVEELPEEPIDVVEVIEAVEQPPPPVPEPEIKPQTSSSSAEPTPKKTKAKKNKIKIEETEDVLEVDQTPAAAVVTEPIVPIEENVVVVEEKKQSKPKKNKKSKEDANEKLTDANIDLIPMIMKTPMDDMEIQNVIDLLLTKQVGTSGSVNHDWIEASEKNETKQSQKQLAEKETLLVDEEAKTKSLTARMNDLRQELNSLKSAHVNSQKYLSEHESQRKHLEARLQHEMEGHQRYVQTLQGQIQYHSSRAQGLQHSLDSLSAQQQQFDPSIYNELETLRSIKMNLEAEKHAYETERSGYHVQCKQQQDEIQQLQQKLAKKANDCEDAKNNLKNAVDKNQQLTERLSISEQKNNTENDQTEEIKRRNQELEAKVTQLSTLVLNLEESQSQVLETSV